MGAPLGNQFWKNRSKHGVDALFTDQNLLWESAAEYFEWCETNPLIAIEYYGKDAKRCEVPKVRTFTYMGLCLYLGVNTQYFSQFKDSELGKTKDFALVLTRIADTIYNQKFEHAAAGFLNANFIAKDLGLVEKMETSNTHSISKEDLANMINTIEG